MKTWSSYLVTLFVTLGVGKIPFAPGTWGTVVGVALWWLFQPPLVLGLVLIVATFLVSIPLINLYEKQSGAHDPKEVIIDEVIGVWVTLLMVPLTPMNILVGFLLFRFFDILKPFPISWLDREVGGGFGTLCDDVAAGLLARVLLGYLLSLEFQWMTSLTI